MVNQDYLARICKHRKEIGGEAMFVLMALLANVGFGNEVLFSRIDLAAEVGMAPSNASRALRKLIDLGLIRRGRKIGSSYSYIIDEDFVWKGSFKAHKEARKNRLEAAV